MKSLEALQRMPLWWLAAKTTPADCSVSRSAINPSSSVVHLVDDRVSGSSVRSPEPLGARQTAKIDSRGPGVMPGGSRELLV